MRAARAERPILALVAVPLVLSARPETETLAAKQVLARSQYRQCLLD
jgi:hypothetical protein